MTLQLKTTRMVLRELNVSDAQDFFLLNGDPEVLKYTGDVPFESKAAAREFLNNYKVYQKHGFGRWAAVLKDSGTFIGWCGLSKTANLPVDLGFRFFKKYWNNGYATEAAKSCLEHGHTVLGIQQIIGRCHEENIASKRVLEKAGMQFWKNAQDAEIGKIKIYKSYI